jgi:hypothetical protein
MTDLKRNFRENVYDLNAILHPGSVFDHPRDVLAERFREQRNARSSHPGDYSPRTPPGGKPVRLKSIDRIATAA